jgi:hypothetical protein
MLHDVPVLKREQQVREEVFLALVRSAQDDETFLAGQRRTLRHVDLVAVAVWRVDHADPTLPPPLALVRLGEERSDFVVGKDASGREERPATRVHEAPLRHDPEVHMIQQQGSARGQVDELAPLRREDRVAAEARHQLAFEVQHGASASHSTINRREPCALHPDHRRRHAVSRVGPARGHEWQRKWQRV